MDNIIFDITNRSLFNYGMIIVICIFVGTVVLDINLGHIFSLLVIIVVLYLYTTISNKLYITDNESLEYKMNTLLPPNYDYIPKWFYIDADFIILFDSIKSSLGLENTTNYYRMIKNVDDILEIKYNLELQTCSPPIPPDQLIGELQYKAPDCTAKIDKNTCRQQYNKAVDISKEVLNYGNGLILTSNLNQSLEWIYLSFMKRLAYLLKRNLNDIKENCGIEDEQYVAAPLQEYENTIDKNFKWYN